MLLVYRDLCLTIAFRSKLFMFNKLNVMYDMTKFYLLIIQCAQITKINEQILPQI